MQLENKKVLITGAGTGIGKATIKRFLEEGATIYATSMQPETLVDFENQDKITVLPCDITKEESIQNAINMIGEKEEKLDCMITICEKMFRGGVQEINADILAEANQYICTAPMLFTKYATPLLKKSTNGSITHNVPMAAYMTETDYINSSFATAMINYTRQSTSQIRPVRVNALLYGIISDHLLTQEEVAKFSTPERLAKIPAGRLGTSADVAGVNAFLSSDRASYLNSCAWAVDGGYYTMNPRSMGNNGI